MSFDLKDTFSKQRSISIKQGKENLQCIESYNLSKIRLKLETIIITLFMVQIKEFLSSILSLQLIQLSFPGFTFFSLQLHHKIKTLKIKSLKKLLVMVQGYLHPNTCSIFKSQKISYFDKLRHSVHVYTKLKELKCS